MKKRKPNLPSLTLKKIARRFRAKGTASPTGVKITAQELWEKNYSFSNPPAKRAGTKRRLAREEQQRKGGA